MATDREIIAASLAPMFAEARAKGLWFYSAYADVWLSPNELETAHEEGVFLWGASNWRLLNPFDKLADMKRQIERLEVDRQELAVRIVRSRQAKGGAA